MALQGCEKYPQDRLDFEQSPLSRYQEIESVLKTEQLSGFDHGPVARNFINSAQSWDLKKSAFYFRPESSGLPLRVKYYFEPSDSLVRLIVYEWNTVTPDMNENEIVETTAAFSQQHDTYTAKFDELVKQMNGRFGPATSGDGVIRKESFQSIERWYSDMTWAKDNLTVEVQLSLIPTLSYRVFCKVYWAPPKGTNSEQENNIVF